MITPRPNYGITRIDQPDKKNHGFYVRITHKGRQHQKFFPDKSSGGKGKALKLAKAHRDELLSKMPKYKQEIAARKKRKALKSGIPGITHVVSKVGDKSYQYWQAAWADVEGRRRTAKFSIAKYGKEEALDMATKRQRKEKRQVSRARRTT